MKRNKEVINVQGAEITILRQNDDDYISLTNMASQFGGDDKINIWMRTVKTIEFLAEWEQAFNPNFKPHSIVGFKKEVLEGNFWMSPKKWKEATSAVGLYSKSGRYAGGTFAHKDIAFEFATWLSPKFKVYFIRDYQALKKEQAQKKDFVWLSKRQLAKTNYREHTDAIKDNLILIEMTKEQERLVYAIEADIINIAVFNQKAAQWENENPHKEGNMRDYGTVLQLVVLCNIECENASLIRMGVPRKERIQRLNVSAARQLNTIKLRGALKELHEMDMNTRLI